MVNISRSEEVDLDLHDFSQKEYLLRQKKVQKLMTTNNLDALIITDSANYRLLAGARPITRNRPVILVVPKSGKPTLIVNTFMASNARKFTWLDDIRTYEIQRFTLNPVKKIFIDLGLSKATIGAEFDLAYFPSAIAMQLKNAFPNAKFVDASDLLLELRAVKTNNEIKYIRKACEITANAYDKLFSTIKEGNTEEEIAKILFNMFIEAGATQVFPKLLINSGGEYVGTPTSKPLRLGDLLWFDSGCQYRGYHSDFGRIGTVGPPSRSQLETWNKVLKIVTECIKIIKPGIELNKIHKAGVAACKKIGLDPSRVSGVLSERRLNIGHSIGLEGVEPPMIDPWNKTIVKPNMVLTIEPTIIKSNGVFHIECDVLVTDDGSEIISRGNTELHQIARR